MRTIDLNISEIHPYENNPRRISDEAVEKVADSIREFGFQQPIVVDSAHVIIDRWEAYTGKKAEKIA